jgi:rubrerythrin
MTVTINAFQAFEIAERIERNGARFYRRAAEICEDPGVCKLLLELAAWEHEHEKIFITMREQILGPHNTSTSFRPEETLPDPRVMAGLAVFGIRAEPTEELDGQETQTDILQGAVEKEKDSIFFYNGLKDFLSDPADGGQIDRIITEEMQHVRILHESLKGLTETRK